jgi:hypothetical protein
LQASTSPPHLTTLQYAERACIDLEKSLSPRIEHLTQPTITADTESKADALLREPGGMMLRGMLSLHHQVLKLICNY